MRRLWILSALLFCMIGCHRELPENGPLPTDYTLKQAQRDGILIWENGNITAGEEHWDDFVAKTEKGHPASLRYVCYYTLGDPSLYGEEYYESVKDEYPLLFLHELRYDGEGYTVRWVEDGEEIVRHYPYMVRFAGENPANYRHSGYVRYVLVHDNTLSWADIEQGLFSSRMGDYIDHYTVYNQNID